MTKKGAEILRKAKESDKTPEEAWEEIKKLNEEIDWNIEEMLPEVFNEE